MHQGFARDCLSCNGEGTEYKGGRWSPCPECGGSGRTGGGTVPPATDLRVNVICTLCKRRMKGGFAFAPGVPHRPVIGPWAHPHCVRRVKAETKKETA